MTGNEAEKASNVQKTKQEERAKRNQERVKIKPANYCARLSNIIYTDQTLYQPCMLLPLCNKSTQ